MKKWTLLMAFLLVFQLFPNVVVYADSVPSVSAKSAVLMDAETGRVLFGKDENTRRGMASTTKIMTALVALEQCEPNRLVTVAPEACGVEGSSVYLFPEEQITMETLLYALMLQSANDAAEAIAYEISGSIEGFAALMNEKAKAFGLSDTHFENPHGLDHKEHYTTALELAEIAAKALEHELFCQIVSTKKKAIPLHNGEATRLLVNHNRLLREYEDIIGIKTGYTRATGRTLVSAAKRDGVTLICVTLDDGNDWADHRALLDYGFSLYESFEIAKIGEYSMQIPVCGGEASAVLVQNTEALTVHLPKNHGTISAVWELPQFLYAGFEKYAEVGRIRFFSDGVEIGMLKLLTTESISCLPKKQTILQKIFSLLGK